MDLGLRGKGVVVTGGSKGIGRSIALAFAREGANVAFCARGAGALEKTAAEVRATGVKAFAAPCDVSQASDLNAFLDQAREELGGVDVLVNNVSAIAFGDDEAGWRTSFDTDLMATVRATWKVVPWMEQSGGGSIIHISSVSGMEAGSPPAYAAVKAALFSHSKTLAIQLAPKNIRVNTVAPGSIEFPDGFWEHVKGSNSAMYENIRASIPSNRFGKPEEVADAVVFLASARASWITGVALIVDGGQHKGNF